MLIFFCYFDGGQWPFNDMLEQEKELKGDPPFFAYLKTFKYFLLDLTSYRKMKFHQDLAKK